MRPNLGALRQRFQRFTARFGSRQDAIEALKLIKTELTAAEAAAEKANDHVAFLENKYRDAIRYLRESIQCDQILPSASPQILQKLIDNEQVHRLNTIEDLIRYRMGDKESNKRCFARISYDGKKPEMTAAIFTALFDITSNTGPLSFDNIPGNIHDTLNMVAEPFAYDEHTKTVVAILYTISGNDDQGIERGGRPLAGDVYNLLHEEAKARGYNLIISTLSPVRKFTSYLATISGYNDIIDLSKPMGTETKNEPTPVTDQFMEDLKDPEYQAAIKQELIRYLVEQKDPVLNFHLGNGAYIGDIKFNLDNPKDWVMINYIYPHDRETLELQSQFYKGMQRRLMAPHLFALCDSPNGLPVSETRLTGSPSSQGSAVALSEHLTPADHS